MPPLPTPAHPLLTAIRALLLCALTLANSPTPATTSTPIDAPTPKATTFATPHQEALYRDLLTELRCLVCANQSLADSNADLAKDLRAKVREMVAHGATRETITAYMVQRYGDYVLYRPPLSPATLLLWLAPFLLAALAFALAIRHIRSRTRTQTQNQTRASASPSPPVTKPSSHSPARLKKATDLLNQKPD